VKDTPTPPACAAPSDPARQIESPIEAALDRLARVLNMWEATTGEPLSHSEIDAARAELAALHAEREKMRAERDRYRAALARVAHIAGGEAQIARNALARG
jgi:uncharacterized protein YpuA (DUF1002 family)